MKKLFKSRLFIILILMAVQLCAILVFLYDLSAMSRYIQAALYAAALFVALLVANRPGSTYYKMTWIMLILVFPIFGMVMYLLFSQKKLTAAQRSFSDALFKRGLKELEQDASIPDELKKISEDAYLQSRYIFDVTTFPLYKNTALKYYPNGESFFTDLKTDLKNAKKYIFLEYFIIEFGEMWGEILAILEEKVKEGVDVRLMYDAMGCNGTLPRNYYKTLLKKGIKCAVSNPLRPILNSSINNRDHRKITVIDGNVAYTGGANFGDEYINAVERFGHWKDACARAQGEAVRPFLVLFLYMWYMNTKEAPDFQSFAMPTPDPAGGADAFAQLYYGSPLDRTRTCENVYLNIINRAQKYVYINTPYLIIDEKMVSSLTNAAKSGVDVRLTVPAIPDKKLVYMVTKSNFARLISGGVKIYKYTPGFIHSKTFVSDDCMGVIGTINMDYRSFYLNFECGLFYYDKKTAAAMRDDYIKTCGIGRQISLEEARETGRVMRIVTDILRLLGPLF